MKEKISVLMSVYNENEQELKESIESILNQTYENIEFIIVIDKPEDTWRIDFIKKYNNPKIKMIINETNIGLPESLNVALENATGEYIARMDADDISDINRLKLQIEFLKKYNYDLCGSNVQYFSKEGNQQIVIFPQYNKNVKKLLKFKNCVLHSTWLGKVYVFRSLNGYRNIFACEDYDFLLRAESNNFLIGNVQEILLKIRLTENSISRSNSGKQELIAEFLNKNFRNKKNITVEDVNNFIISGDFNKRLKRRDHYSRLKDKRAKFRKDKFPKYYLYTILLLINIQYALKDIAKKIYFKYMIIKENKERSRMK